MALQDRVDATEAGSGYMTGVTGGMTMKLAVPARARRQRAHLYGRQRLAEHRVVPVGHGLVPQYSRTVRRMLTRLFR